MMNVPLDIPSFSTQNHKEFCWPIPYESYDFLAYGFVDEALKILESQEGDVKIALTCKLSDILIDITHVARQAIEIKLIRDGGREISYDRDASVVVDYCLNDGKEIIRHHRCNALKDKALIRARYWKRIVSNCVSPTSAQGYHAMSLNSLMSEWLAAENVETVNTLVEFYMYGRPQKNEAACREIASMFSQALNKAYNFEYPVDGAIQRITRYHIEQALGDIAFLKRSKLSKSMKQGLVSGTPKYEGRLLGWYFQDHGKDVTRHAHGGERVFYKDYIWPLAELPYCSTYFAHSQAEANVMGQRIKNGDYAVMPDMEKIQFKSRGSDKHQAIYKSAVPSKNNKTLIYVSSVYLGDLAPNLPAFKVPDSPYFDFQSRLLSFLRDDGWRVIVKPHPKGLYNPAKLLEPYADDVVIAPFDPNMFEAEVFLFDFAGTAFFDTLASKQRVTLLNLGRRPFDQAERKQLEKRCSVYDCGFDALGRVDLDKEAISNAIAQAPRAGFKDFTKRYTA